VPVEVAPGEKSRLTWTTTGAKSCRLTPHDPSTVPSEGAVEVSPDDTTTYTLTAEGDGTSVQEQVTVGVVTVRIVNFAASPCALALGGRSTFSWVVRGAESCVIQPFRQSVNPEAGTWEHGIDSSGQYTLEASGYNRQQAASVFIAVEPVEIDAFGAVPTPSIIDPGGESVLHWATRWSSGCAIEPGVGAVAAVGTATVQPSKTTTYTLTAEGKEKKERSVTVTVGAAIAWISCTAGPSNPQQVTVAWETAGGATTLAAWTGSTPDPRPVGSVGSAQVTVGETGLTRIKLAVAGAATSAACELQLLGPAVKAGASLTAFEIRSESGFTSTQAEVTVRWQAAGASLRGRVEETGRDWSISGLTGKLDFQLGPRIPSQNLWSGTLTVKPAAAPAGAGAGGAAAEVSLGWTVQ